MYTTTIEEWKESNFTILWEIYVQINEIEENRFYVKSLKITRYIQKYSIDRIIGGATPILCYNCCPRNLKLVSIFGGWALTIGYRKTTSGINSHWNRGEKWIKFKKRNKRQNRGKKEQIQFSCKWKMIYLRRLFSI